MFNQRAHSKMRTFELEGRSLCDDSKSKADALNLYVKSTHKRGSVQQLETSTVVGEILVPDTLLGEEGTLRILEGLNENKSASPDGIHPTIVKPVGRVVEKFMRAVWPHIRSEVPPMDWKLAAVVAIYTGGSRIQKLNY